MPFAIMDAISGSTDYGEKAAEQEAARKKAITIGTADINKAFSGFTPAFYQQRAQDYQDFALPQVAKQYRQARNDIGFNIANRGYFGGSAAQKQWGDLADTYARATQNVADVGQSQAQALQSSVENAKNTQLGFLYQSADPAQAAQSATAAAASFQTPATFPMVAQQFGDLLNQYYYSQLVNSYRPTSYAGFLPNSGGTQFPIGQPSSVGQ